MTLTAALFRTAMTTFTGFALTQAWASKVSFSSLPGTGTPFGSAADYRSNWNSLVLAHPAPPVGYGSTSVSLWEGISNQGVIPGGSGVNISFHYQIQFTVDPSESGAFDFRIAPDFGFGGAAFFNGNEVGYSPNDLWWDQNWNNTSQLFEFSETLSPGNYTIDVYGEEGCCDGPTGAQFRVDGGSWNSFGDRDGLNLVPEGDGTPVLVSAAALLALQRIRRRVRH